MAQLKLKKKDDKGITEMYQKLSDIEHVLKRPNVYIGSIENKEEELHVLSADKDKIIKKESNFNPAILKLFDEAISNASDHYIRMNELILTQEKIKKGELPPNDRINIDRIYSPVTYISVQLTDEIISVENNGTGIDIVEHPQHKIYIPELIIFNLKAGTNFNDAERQGAGVNGMGISLVAIYSKEFTIETVDESRHLKYVQVARDNLSVIEKPVITNYKGKPYTKVTFKLDFARFSVKNLNTADNLSLIEKRIYDISATCHMNYTNKLKVSINDKEIKVCTFEKYVNMFIGNSKTEAPRLYLRINDNWEIAVSLSPTGKAEQVSYVNGINTYRGGTHVEFIENYLSRKMVELLTDSKVQWKPTAKQIKDSMMLLINCKIQSPSFESQSKTQLTTQAKDLHFKGVKFEIPEEFIKKLMTSKMGILDASREMAMAKAEKDISKTDAKGRNKRIYLEKGIDAPYAIENLTKRKKCSLLLTEGDSALSAAVTAISALPEEERKYYGMFPLRGKLINLKDKKITREDENEEINSIKQLVGLKHKVDYSIQENRNTLRYHRIIVLCDSDDDGKHIQGLIFNLFHSRWKELMQIDGFFYTILTPNIVIFSDEKLTKPIKTFYSLSSFEKWREGSSSREIGKWYPKYYKGLGTSTPSETRKWFINPKTQEYSWHNYINQDEEDSILQEILKRNDTTEIQSIPFIDDNESVSDTDSDDLDHLKYIENYKKFFIDFKDVPLADLSLTLAFSKNMANCRKGWISSYLMRKEANNINYSLSEKPFVNYYDFITHQLVEYASSNVIRSIPSIMDGLKPSQRKPLYCSISNRINKQIKVSQLANQTAKETDYHHGENSLCETIINMAQNYVGSNNINFFEPVGQFGTRLDNGKDNASPRYIHTHLTNIATIIYDYNDEYLYRYLDNDGVPIEPIYFAPIIPMILINGTAGIGTGWSSDVPNYNPRDVINNIRRYLKKEPIEPMIPWYRGFKGTIEPLNGFKEFKVTGTYSRQSDKEVIITELPIGTNKCKSFMGYKTFLEKLVIGNTYDDLKVKDKSDQEKEKGKQILEDVDCLITDTNIKCILTFPSKEILDKKLESPEKFEKELCLTTTIKPSHMNLHNANGLIVKYNSAEEILMDYAQVRYNFYIERKELLLSNIKLELDKISERIRFLTYQIDESHELKVQKCTKVTLIEMLEKYEFRKLGGKLKKKLYNRIVLESYEGEDRDLSYDYLIKMPIYSLSIDHLEELKKEKEPVEQKYNNLNETSVSALWEADLDVLSEELNKFDSEWDIAYKQVVEPTGSSSKLKLSTKRSK